MRSWMQIPKCDADDLSAVKLRTRFEESSLPLQTECARLTEKSTCKHFGSDPVQFTCRVSTKIHTYVVSRFANRLGQI
jgi:hypothetical protein